MVQVHEIVLNPVDEPLLVFGGPYGNLQATQALRRAAVALGIRLHRVLCTGDVVAYGADPQATVDLIRDWGVEVVMGNCEESLGFDAEDCDCGFAEGTVCDTLSAAWFAFCRQALDGGAKAWMRNLSRRVRRVVGDRRLVAIHGGATDISRFVFASTDDSVKRKELDLLGADGVLAGHCGLPFTVTPGGGLWHNAGAIGLPANDGTPRGWFSLLTPTPDGILIAHHHLDYDHAAAARSMARQGLPRAYARTLRTGLWPAMDILPETERSTAGQPLTFAPLMWSPPARLTAA